MLLPSAVWKRLKGESNQSYCMKIGCDGKVFRVAVSDLVRVWTCECSEDKIVKICQDLNPLIECDNVTIASKIFSVIDRYLDTEEDTKSTVDIDFSDETTLLWKFKTSLDGMAFKFNIELSEGPPRTFFTEVTSTLVAISEELLCRQQLLFLLLEKKDIEISQYKMEGATLLRRNVATQPFSKDDFVSVAHLSTFSESLSDRLSKVNEVTKLISRPLVSQEQHKKTTVPSHHQSTPESQFSDIDNEQSAASNANSETEACTIKQEASSSETKRLKRKIPKLNL